MCAKQGLTSATFLTLIPGWRVTSPTVYRSDNKMINLYSFPSNLYCILLHLVKYIALELAYPLTYLNLPSLIYYYWTGFLRSLTYLDLRRPNQIEFDKYTCFDTYTMIDLKLYILSNESNAISTCN